MNAPQRVELIEAAENLTGAQLPDLSRTHAMTTAAVQPATPTMMLAMAVERGASLEYIEKLMALQERWEANEARKAFTVAMTDFKAEPLEIFKRKAVGYATKEGDFVGYKHAELSDVADVVVPAMARHGLSHRWDVKQESARVIVTCTVTHRMGHSESVTMDAAPDDSGKKNKIQQIASSVTYLQRYTLLAIVGLATKNEDDDGAGGGDVDEAELLQGFRDASLLGTPALRAHYTKVQPTDEWWAANSKALKEAAKKADEKGAAK
jgi:hypothetical protein